MNLTDDLHARIDPDRGTIEGGEWTERRLSDLEGYFADEAAYDAALEGGDTLIYTVSSIATAEGDGQLHYGLGRILPGRIGAEYHLTKGHFHARREAAELYVGLKGVGAMVLEDEHSGACRMVPLEQDSAVYVPGHTAHRTINTGDTPLVYLGIYPADAGHDYAFIAERNFSKVVVDVNGRPALVERGAWLHELKLHRRD